MGKVSERPPSTRTEMERSVRKLIVQDRSFGLNPKEGSLARRPACHTRSKALEISSAMTLDSP